MSASSIAISFIMPSYKPHFLDEAITSIINQSNSDWELVIVDDDSPYGLESIVSSFSDSRIRYYRNDKNIGSKDLVAQWNRSIKHAKGDWIVLAADDDLYLPTYVEEILRLSQVYPKVDLIRSRVEQIDEKGHHLWDDGVFPEFSDKARFLSDWLSGKSFTCIGNYTFRRKALESIGGFVNYPCGFGSDIETPIRLSQNGVANTSEMLFRFRQSPVHLSADSSRYIEKLKGITQLSKFLRSIDYLGEEYNERYLQKKCIYDYYNLVIKNLPFNKLGYLSYCTYASVSEKIMMLLKWLKNKF